MNTSGSRTDAPEDECRQLLSALYDGDAAALDGCCAAWREDAQARATWHAYHLIGDVLRSDDLATVPSHDAAFLAAVRARLAHEPVVLAPVEAVSRRRRQSWLVPVAAAAGFVAVAGVLVVVRMSSPELAGPALAVGPAPAASITLAGNVVAAPAAPVYSGQMIRDPQLDRYFQAHRTALVGGTVVVPGGVPRSIEVMAPLTPALAPVAR